MAKTGKRHQEMAKESPVLSARKSRSTSTSKEGSDSAEDWVAMNRLKPFHTQPEEGEVGLQQLPRRGRPARVVRAASPKPPTPAAGPASPTPSTPAYSPPVNEFPPLEADPQTPRRRRERACRVPKGHWKNFRL